MHSSNYAPFFVVLVMICSITMCKESKQMNDHNVHQGTLSPWLIDIKTATASKKAGQLITNDASGSPVVIDWHITDILSPDIAAFKKDVCNLAAEVTAAMEVQFLHKHPETVSQGGFAKACEPLFAQGIENVDWQAVQETLQATIKQFYLMDISKFGAEIINKLTEDVYFFASIKDQKTDTLLGFIMSAITPALPYGDIKVINVVVAPEAEKRELEKILLSTIFNVIPQVKRMFTITRPTNIKTLAAYSACGLTQDYNPVQDPNHQITMNHFVVFEYRTEQSDILQKTAKTLIG
jgi:hypothetical protein